MSFLKTIQNNAVTDEELVKQFRQSGDLRLLGDLYQRHMELLYGVCLKYLKEQEAAKDAVMQLFEELVVKLPKHDVENFRAWVYQVARNHCLMQLRTPKNLKTVEFNPAIMQNEQELHLNGVFEKEEHLVKLESCIEKLPGDQRNIVQLFYMENKCYNEIAGITGHEWKQVRSAIQNGRRNLKICMDNHEALSPMKKIKTIND